MAKIGVEVEGRLKGLRSIFLSWNEWQTRKYSPERCVELLVSQVYVSDHLNAYNSEDQEEFINEVLGYADLGILVTFEVTCVFRKMPCAEISFMLYYCSGTWSGSLLNLREHDQIKIEHDRHVLVAPVETCFKTIPEDFDGDIDLE